MSLRIGWRRLGALAVLCGSALSALAGELIQLPTRDGVTVPVYWQPREGATATLVLLPGGAGSFGEVTTNGPNGGNFLIRSGSEFSAHGFHVAMVSRPSDQNDLDNYSRSREWHLQDLHAVLLKLKALADVPVWLVGTSRGTVSAAASAIFERDSGLVQGLVLTSSVTGGGRGFSVPMLDLDRVKVPALVVHHAQDGCNLCQPGQAHRISDAMTGAPVRALRLLEGGRGMRGDACGAFHYHGYVGMESEAVALIANWIRHPVGP